MLNGCREMVTARPRPSSFALGREGPGPGGRPIFSRSLLGERSVWTSRREVRYLGGPERCSIRQCIRSTYVGPERRGPYRVSGVVLLERVGDGDRSTTA